MGVDLVLQPTLPRLIEVRPQLPAGTSPLYTDRANCPLHEYPPDHLIQNGPYYARVCSDVWMHTVRFLQRRPKVNSFLCVSCIIKISKMRIPVKRVWKILCHLIFEFLYEILIRIIWLFFKRFCTCHALIR